MKNTYDVAIIGGGIGGLMCAYELKLNYTNANIVIIEKGNELENRKCPASKNNKCVKCDICNITTGIAGAGAFSDGKFNLGTNYGGTLGKEVGENFANFNINKVNDILTSFGADVPIYNSDIELKEKCEQHNLKLLDMNVRHLGTDKNYKVMLNLVNWLKINNVSILTCTECIEIMDDNNKEYYILRLKHLKSNIISNEVLTSPNYLLAKHVVIATGRASGNFVVNTCNNFNIPITCNKVDIGVRVEMKDEIWKEFSDKIYEPKILNKSKTYNDECRMFCFNKGGLVSAENNRGIITANGHAYVEKDKKTDNCNFAILSSMQFTEPFNQPTEYCEHISRLGNMLGAGNVIVQRFGDLVNGHRSTMEKINKNSVQPTLKAEPGDIGTFMPYRHLLNIIETIYALDKIAPGTANYDTLLYGCESKYYSIKPKFINKFKIRRNLYCIGDGSGVSRGLSQAGAMGIIVADNISSNWRK